MKPPRVISKTVCVYCGVRIPGSDYRNRLPAAVACKRHAELVALDPHYTHEQPRQRGARWVTVRG